MAAVKTLRPQRVRAALPFIWHAKDGLVEDMRYLRWTPEMCRQMQQGTYDWSRHVETRALNAEQRERASEAGMRACGSNDNRR